MTRDEVARALASDCAPVRGDSVGVRCTGSATKAAAVLVGLVDRANGFTIVFCKRSPDLLQHAGEVCFPGGRIESGESEIDAALREANEETGLDPARVQVLHRLETYVAGSGYAIAPIVAFVNPPVELVADGVEMDAVFEVPLSFFMDKCNRRRENTFWNGRHYSYSVYEYGNRVIWGATAAILDNLLDGLRGDPT